MRDLARIEERDEHDVTCTHCGTEIADKALICFRCGRSTTELLQPRSSNVRPVRRPPWVFAIGLLVLVAAGLFMASAAAGRIPEWLRWTIVGGAAVVLIARLARRMKK